MIADHLLACALVRAGAETGAPVIAAIYLSDFVWTDDAGNTFTNATLPSGFGAPGANGRAISSGGPGAVAVATDNSYSDTYLISSSDLKTWSLGAWIATRSEKDVKQIAHLKDGSLVYGLAWSKSTPSGYIFPREVVKAPGDGSGAGFYIYPPAGDDPDNRAWIYGYGDGYVVVGAGSYLWLYDGTTWTEMTPPTSGWPHISGAGAEHQSYQIAEDPGSGRLSFRGLYSDDGGSTWAEAYDPAVDVPNIYGTAFADGTWIRLDADDAIEISSDAITWTNAGAATESNADRIEPIGGSFYWASERVPVSGAGDLWANAVYLGDYYQDFAG